MRRLVLVAVLLVAAALAATAAARSGEDGGAKANEFTVELDNAFGIVDNADVKVAGVRAGHVTDMRVDPETAHALVDFQITESGFGSLREDAFCESRPQSLIGEYYVDCRPGTSERRLPAGGRIPIRQTASTIPVDLINNIMRRPYRERFGILISELGAGVGGRGGDLNDAIRRAVPALRETDQVLAELASQNRVLSQLTKDADTVLGDLAGNRRDVGRWVTQTRRTASASAERREDIRASLARLPGFLREMTPTMAALGDAADEQTPALQNLDAASGQLERLFRNIPAFADATRVSLRSLAEASRTGRPAIEASKPTIRQLGEAVAHMPEVSSNLAIMLEHLGDRRFAVEKDPRSPGGQGYTGLEAVLQYVFDQSMAINIFDANSHLLKVNLFESKCSDYQNLESLKEQMKKDPSFFEDCGAGLGPNQPGITQADLTAGRHKASAEREVKSRKPGKDGARPAANGDPAAPPSFQQIIADAIAGLPHGSSGGGNTATGPAAPDSAQAEQLLDFLLAP
jgi:virulence factor Mce-like protein